MRRYVATSLALLTACTVVISCSDRAPVTPLVQAPTGASFTTGNPINIGSKEPYTVAVIGDTPYGDVKLAEFPGLVDLINSDPKVDIVLHLGDIKAGSSSDCSTTYFKHVKSLFDGFQDPLVYTPGDNEWTDCHVASKNNGLYTPTERLQMVRTLFYPVPGQTLGGRKKQVLTQADDPENAAYVENTMWMESQVVFAALNVTGSNDDIASWGTPLPADAGNFQSQADERASRSKANAAWLKKAFDTAQENDAAAIVLLFQADMWDASSALSGFDALVKDIGDRAAAFGKPVLLLEGDSHVFRVDNPYSASSPLHALHANTPIAENVQRLVVEGSAAGRTEYTRLTIDPRASGSGIFSWERVPLH